MSSNSSHDLGIGTFDDAMVGTSRLARQTHFFPGTHSITATGSQRPGRRRVEATHGLQKEPGSDLHSPGVPGVHPLLEQCDVLVVSHRIIQGREAVRSVTISAAAATRATNAKVPIFQ